MDFEELTALLGVMVVAAPALLLAVLGLTMLLGRPLSERATAFWTEACVLIGLSATIAILVLMLVTGSRHVPIEFGHLIDIPQEEVHFQIKFVFDRLSVPLVLLSFILIGTIGAFANRYLHREPGYRRFFLLYALFLLGMISATLAGTIETLFVGWELVGLSSALLVAYFHERPNPVRNGRRIWTVYRLADAAFLMAAVVLHHVQGGGEFSGLMGDGPWPQGQAALTSSQALGVGLLLLLAAAGKSGLVPFSGWLPRAMEGPTPSSAVFYGALSVHLGTFLLLRVSPVLAQSTALCVIVVIVGLASAALGAVAGRVQTDVKSALAFASVTQVGIITAEIGLGFRYLALVHIIGHACLRTLQLLRAPSLIRDYHALENALGTRLNHLQAADDHWLPARIRTAVYRFAIERGYLDALLDRWCVQPFLAMFQCCRRLEDSWTGWLAGEGVPPAEPDDEPPATRAVLSPVAADLVEEIR